MVLYYIVCYLTILYNTVIYYSVLYYTVQVVGGIIDISTSEEEEEVADPVEVDVVVPDKVEKVVDYTITLHQKCTLWDGKGGKRMVVMKTVFFYYK